jgi:hypothetical protein
MTAAFPANVHLEVRLSLGTLLARRIAAGPAAPAARLKAVMEAAWTDPLVVRRWRGVALRLDAAACEGIAQDLCAAVSPSMRVRHLGLAQATEGWALETGGLCAEPAWGAMAFSAAGLAMAWPRRRAVRDAVQSPLPLNEGCRLAI